MVDKAGPIMVSIAAAGDNPNLYDIFLHYTDGSTELRGHATDLAGAINTAKWFYVPIMLADWERVDYWHKVIERGLSQVTK